jgi:hypothetical protein
VTSAGDTTSAAWTALGEEGIGELAARLNEVRDPLRKIAIIRRVARHRYRGSNGSRPTTTGRRSRETIEAVRDAMVAALVEDQPMTVRQVFYRLVSAGEIGKTEAEYKATVVRLLAELRLAGEIPFGWIADNTRWMRKPVSFSGLEQALALTRQTYRRGIWNDQDAYVEVWLEKDALAGVVYEVTGEWDVPLMVTRGYPSLSYLHGAAEAIASARKPAFVYYFGDHDPSGVDISRNVEARLRQFAPRAEIRFERLAVTEAQIRALGLPTRPTKKTDSRAGHFSGESVEVDAIPPRELREMVRKAIERHVNLDLLRRTESIEAAERKTLGRVIKAMRESA